MTAPIPLRRSWRRVPPAEPGMPLGAIDTPALLIEMSAFERNLDAMAKFARGAGVALRPHAKTHKSAAVARAQIERGAVGVCVQKPEEAAALAAAGIDDIFVSNEVVGAAKCERLARLARGLRRLALAVDDPRGVAELAVAVKKARSRLDVFVELDVGQRRCGVAPGNAAVELAAAIAAQPGLSFAGLHAYHGAAQHLREPAERQAAIAAALELVSGTRAALQAAGLPCRLVTGAGTGTFELESASRLYGELQVGSYAFMDADYARNRQSERAPRFEQSLFVLCTVMSRSAGHVVVDAGLKAHSVDSGMPGLLEPGWRYAQASDEHGKLVPDEMRGPPTPLDRGDRVRLVPGHCDPTVNLHDWYVCVRDGAVEAIWPIEARGALR